MLDPTRPARDRKFSAVERTAQKAARALAGGDDARTVRRNAGCQGTCNRTDAQLALAGAKKLSALVAKRDYARTILCMDCLLAGLKPKGYWATIAPNTGQGKLDWHVELAPYGTPDTQEGVAVELWCADHWFPCQSDNGIVWHRAAPSIKWNDFWNTLEFHGFHGVVQVWTRPKAKFGGGEWTHRAKYVFRGAEHTSEVMQACKRLACKEL